MKRIVKQCHSNPSIESANSQTKKKYKIQDGLVML